MFTQSCMHIYIYTYIYIHMVYWKWKLYTILCIFGKSCYILHIVCSVLLTMYSMLRIMRSTALLSTNYAVHCGATYIYIWYAINKSKHIYIYICTKVCLRSSIRNIVQQSVYIPCYTTYSMCCVLYIAYYLLYTK